ncbi:unnamed protein product [Mycena citricolor]|uniref:EF-hand domain-containing protein n=1 Tax=Mycena citricolor TaxID=2018698 RepID=A0AAD2H6Q1_9AGAR|nr:unnamed protein product [Mycena citricolor]
MSRRLSVIHLTRTLSGEKTENAEDPARSALFDSAHTAALSSTSLSASQQKIDRIGVESFSIQKLDLTLSIEDKLSVPINQTKDTYATLQTFCTANAAVLNTASSALAAAANIDVKSIEATISRFAETSAVVMKGLDVLMAVHPFVGVAVIAFKSIISLDITRRQNDKKVLAVKLQMQDLMTVLFQLGSFRDPEDKASNGTTLKDRMSELMKTVAADITSCGSACDVYLKKSFLGEYPNTLTTCTDTLFTAKTIKSKIYEARLASYVANFTDHKKSIAFALTMHTSRSVDTANRKLDDQTAQLDSIEVKMEALFRKLDTPREREVQKFLDDNGGARACISDEAALAELMEKSGDTTLASDTSAQIAATKTLLLRELSEDVDEAFRKNALLFDGKMEIQSQELKTAMKDGEERLRQAIKEGLHERIMDEDLQTLWKDQGWKGSVKARYFVLALNDYYSELFSKHIPESKNSSAPPSPEVTTINLIAELPSVPKYEDDDRWALKYITVANIQFKPILETVDDDGTGFVTIKETNEFIKSGQKEQCRHVMCIKNFPNIYKESSSLLSWTAYWAAGWHTSVTWHKNRIYSLLKAMLRLPTNAHKPILRENIQAVDEYLGSRPFRRIELLLRSTRSAGPEWDEDLAKVREKIEGHENKRIQDRLTKLRYELDYEGLRLITGNKRIERFIYPLLNALLKRHFDILRLACMHVLDDGEFDTMTGSLGVIFEAVDERMANLEAVFKSNSSNVNERFDRFAFGMFQADYISDKKYSDVAKNTIAATSRDEGYEFDADWEDTGPRGHSFDAFNALNDKRKAILIYPTVNDANDVYNDDVHPKDPDPEVDSLEERSDERRRFSELMIKVMANHRHLAPPWVPLSEDELNELYNLHTVLGATTQSLYDAVELDLRKVVKQERDCDMCHKSITGPLLFCVQCIDNRFNDGADFCEAHMDQSAEWKGVSHVPSHVSVKTLSRIHHGDKAWIVPEARTVAARIKKQFKGLDAPESAKTMAETGYAFKDAVTEKKRPKCVCCAKEVSLPVWVCVMCVQDIFVCVECDKAKRPIPTDSIPNYQDLVESGEEPGHTLSHPLVYVHDTEPIPQLAKLESMTNEERSIAELDKKMTTMEQRMTVIEEKLDSIIKALRKDSLSSDA